MTIVEKILARASGQKKTSPATRRAEKFTDRRKSIFRTSFGHSASDLECGRDYSHFEKDYGRASVFFPLTVYGELHILKLIPVYNHFIKFCYWGGRR